MTCRMVDLDGCATLEIWKWLICVHCVRVVVYCLWGFDLLSSVECMLIRHSSFNANLQKKGEEKDIHLWYGSGISMGNITKLIIRIFFL